MREAAAGAFNALFKAGAGGIVDTVIPALLTQLQSDSDNSKALEGLQVILSVRPQTLNSMVPRLLHKPITVTNLKALGAVAAAAGGSLQNHLAEILSTILSIASMQTGKPIVQAAQEAARKVSTVTGNQGAFKFFVCCDLALCSNNKRKSNVKGDLASQASQNLSFWYTRCAKSVDLIFLCRLSSNKL